jgi:indolepyruvate ferredoxin oxidoreductase
MAYKDEYEVARLYTDGKFRAKLAQEFEGKPKLTFHLAPPIFGKRDEQGRPLKQAFGPWMMPVFRMLAALRRLRGTPLDFFGRTAERREERRLVEDYRTAVEEILCRWHEVNLDHALAFARLPEQIRGFGHVKEASIATVRVRWKVLYERLFQLTSAPDKAGSAVQTVTLKGTKQALATPTSTHTLA